MRQHFFCTSSDENDVFARVFLEHRDNLGILKSVFFRSYGKGKIYGRI